MLCRPKGGPKHGKSAPERAPRGFLGRNKLHRLGCTGEVGGIAVSAATRAAQQCVDRGATVSGWHGGSRPLDPNGGPESAPLLG